MRFLTNKLLKTYALIYCNLKLNNDHDFYGNITRLDISNSEENVSKGYIYFVYPGRTPWCTQLTVFLEK